MKQFTRLTFLTFIIIFSILNSTTAQKPRTISLGKASNTESIVYDYTIARVIDNRVDKTSIGNVRTGLMNKQKPAITEDSLHLVLSNYLAPIFLRSNKEDKYHLSINNLWISEQVKMTKEVGFVELEVGFFKITDGAPMDYGVCKRSLENGGMDVTNGHAKRIKTALHECLNEFNDSKNTITPQAVSSIEEMVAANYSFDYELLKKGAYKNEGTLLAMDVLDENQSHTMKEKGNKIKRYIIKNKSTGKRTKELFYFDGTDLYMNSSVYYPSAQYFVKNVNQGRFIAFQDKTTDPYAGAAFGAIGAAASAKLRTHILDTKTGKITTLNKKRMQEFLRPYSNLLTTYNAINRKEEEKLLFINKINEMEAN